MRILWHSVAPWVPTGYGRQTEVWVPRLRRLGHEVAISAYHGLQGSVTTWQDIRVYPAYVHQYGADIIAGHAQHWRADIVVTFLDIWVYEPAHFHGLRWVPYFPLDGEGIQQRVMQLLPAAYRILQYSRHGQRMLSERGIESDYVPHGIDTSVYRPGDKERERRRFKLPTDAFVVGVVAANVGQPSRKALPEQLCAVAEFMRRHSDVVLYLHTSLALLGEYSGVHIPDVLAQTGADPKRVFWVDQYLYAIGAIEDEEMVARYRAMDVLLNVSCAEGFCLPVLEAQACGVPAIIGDWTAMRELAFGAILVPREESEPMWHPLGYWWRRPRVGAIVEALEKAYSSDLCALGKQARDGALQYDADRVLEQYWRPALAGIEEKLQGERRIYSKFCEATQQGFR